MLMEMLEKINLKCAYCGKHLGIACVEKTPGATALLAYCCTEHDEADTAKGVEQAMKTVKRIMAEKMAEKNLAPVCSWCGNRHASFEYCYD